MQRTSRTRRAAASALALLAAGGVAALVASAGTAAARGAEATFRLADGAVACASIDSGAVACRAAGAEKARVLRADGTSRVAGVALTWSAKTPVLLESQSWWLGTIRCTAKAGAIRCSAADGAISVGARRIAAAL